MTVAIADFFGSLTHNDYLTLFLLSIIPIVELRGAIVIMGGMVGINKLVGMLCCIAGSTSMILPLLLFIRPLIKKLKQSKRFSKLGHSLENNITDRAEPVLKENEAISEQNSPDVDDTKVAVSENPTLQHAGSESVRISVAESGISVTDKRNSPAEPENNCDADKKKRKRLSPQTRTFLALWAFVAVPLPFTGAWTGSAVGAFTKLKIWQAALAVFIGNIVAAGILTLISMFIPAAYIDYLLYGFLILAVAIGGVLIYNHVKKKEGKIGLKFKKSAKKKNR